MINNLERDLVTNGDLDHAVADAAESIAAADKSAITRKKHRWARRK